MPIPHSCLSCAKTFDSVSALKSHATAKRHKPNPYICEDCDVSFVCLVALQSHMNSSKHAYDYSVNRASAYMDGKDDSASDSDAYSDGSDDSDDTDPYCNGCERHFISTEALNNHLAYSSKHNWCFNCSHDFKSDTSLEQHRNSLAHHDREFKCPFCQSMFKSPSGIAMHIESGCHQFTRHHVTAAVQRMEIVPAISIKRIADVRPPTSLRTYVATEASFDGSVYVCFLCHRKCRTLAALNAHLNSPAHDDDEFRCPKCKTEFKLVSGFVQHLESRACGLAKAGDVQKYFDNLTSDFSRLLKM